LDFCTAFVDNLLSTSYFISVIHYFQEIGLILLNSTTLTVFTTPYVSHFFFFHTIIFINSGDSS